jgi:hypothetical protein
MHTLSCPQLEELYDFPLHHSRLPLAFALWPFIHFVSFFYDHDHGWDGNRQTLPEAEDLLGALFLFLLSFSQQQHAHTQFAFSNCGGFRLERRRFWGELFFLQG